MIKSFDEFINETYLEEPSNPETLDFNHKKMIKNGYTEVVVEEPVDGVEKGDTVYVSATEFGQLEDNSLISCITKDDETILIQKCNLKVKIKDKK